MPTLELKPIHVTSKQAPRCNMVPTPPKLAETLRFQDVSTNPNGMKCKFNSNRDIAQHTKFLKTAPSTAVHTFIVTQVMSLTSSEIGPGLHTCWLPLG